MVLFYRINMKKYVAFLGSAMFFVVCVSLYLMLDTMNDNPDSDVKLMGGIQSKLNGIEDELEQNQKIIDALKDSIRDISHVKNIPVVDSDLKDTNRLDDSKVINMQPRNEVEVSADVCTFAENKPDSTEIQMLNVFDTLPFDDPDGGVWKQGYPISYDETKWQKRKLKVFVVPHSHCDPGWLKTVERYYSDQTKHILNLMVEKLEAHKQMKFIYAEMSFFTMWWNEISEQTKIRTKKLIENGQLEIVTGGWVMTDEANAHYFAMLDQMIEGNQWLYNQLGVKPRSGWAIDPFGHSPTMTYLLKEMGFENMLIQRTHYAVKKYLSKKKQLEFMWRQNWDHDGTTDMFCHMMPFYSYDVPHTCGPNPSICCQFDFKRLPGGKISCPWHIPPQPITSSNVAERAKTLLDQYRKKAQLYGTDVVLVPLGDDFRYDKPEEWDNQYNNYQLLFQYMNSQSDLNVEAQFGTLSDYFDAVHERMDTAGEKFPVLSGDFFTYADREDHYWSGYFTSRPFYKCLDRILEAHLRGAEMLYSVALTQSRRLVTGSEFQAAELLKLLVVARRSLGLYQHHDGITGTAKDHVVVDYGIKHLNALNGLKNVIRETAHFLMIANNTNFTPETRLFDVDETRASHDSLPVKTVISLTEEDQPIVFYNSLTHSRNCVVRVHTDYPHLVVQNAQGEIVPTQVDPYWIETVTYSSTVFKVSFVVSTPGVGMSRYTIRKVKANDNPHSVFSKITFYNALPGSQPQDIFEVQPESAVISVENSDLKLIITKSSGLLESTHLKDSGDTIKTQVEFLTYGTTRAHDKSGAYLFMPDGDAKSVTFNSPKITVTTGPIMSEVTTDLPHVKHKLRLYNSQGLDGLGVDIMNIVDIRHEGNKELTMRVLSDIDNKDDEFFTDLNGYQIIRRKWYKKLPIQANFYPMPSVAYIEDQKHRLSILSGHSLGVASLKTGWLEIIQDRRLTQDDNRGLGQGVMDSKITPNVFRLLIETRQGKHTVPTQPVGYMSLEGFLSSQELMHPVHILPIIASVHAPKLKAQVQFVEYNLPCDLHLVNLRTFQDKELYGNEYRPAAETALILHKPAVHCGYPLRGQQCNGSNKQVSLDEILKDVTIHTATATSLSLIHDHDAIVTSHQINIEPMQIKAFKVVLK